MIFIDFSNKKIRTLTLEALSRIISIIIFDII